MKTSLLEYLVCPDCQGNLDYRVTGQRGDTIEAGTLTCSQCAASFPILRGVPRFVTPEKPPQGRNVETAEAFGWQWQTFRDLPDWETCRAQFLDWVHPIEPAFLQGKVVLDAGCGMGRFSLVSSRFGAKAVIAVDVSDAVEAAQENVGQLPNVHVIQADLLRLPLRQGRHAQLNFCFSIGVLHHLDHPQAGFNALVRHLRSGGTIFAWVYGYENNGWVVHIVNPLRSLFTSRLPRRVLYVLAWGIAAAFYPLLKGVYRPAAHSAAHGLAKRLPYREYMVWLSQFSLGYVHNVVFDHLVAPVAFYLRRDEFEAWFQKAGLEIIDLSWRNQNSWRGHGKLGSGGAS